MRVLITGAGGFLGRRLTNKILQLAGLVGPSGGAEPVTHLTLTDLGPIAPLERVGAQIDMLQGDLADAGFIKTLCERSFDSVFHLASQLTFHAELNPDHAFDVNVAPVRALISAAGNRPRFVFASSIAVFGGAFPSEVSDDIAPLPETTYGTHKALIELLLADASRHGQIDSRALRLPIVLIRPGVTQPVVSDKVAAIVREPLEGRDFASPLPLAAMVPVVSAGAVVRNLLTLHDLPAEQLPPKRALNLPALTVSVAEMVAAATRAGARGNLTIEPDQNTQKVVAGWPQQFVSRYAADLGISPDPDFDAIIADYLEHKAV